MQALLLHLVPMEFFHTVPIIFMGHLNFSSRGESQLVARKDMKCAQEVSIACVMQTRRTTRVHDGPFAVQMTYYCFHSMHARLCCTVLYYITLPLYAADCVLYARICRWRQCSSGQIMTVAVCVSGLIAFLP